LRAFVVQIKINSYGTKLPDCAGRELKMAGMRVQIAEGVMGQENRPMDEFQIDDAVLAVAKPSWKKVALIIVETASKLGNKLPRTAEGYDLVANRIEALIRDGRLEARGNTKEWRTSEVRRQS
jgi:hypothetical protein